MDGQHKVTLAIYSGRPDPVWTVHSHHKSSQKMKEHLDSAKASGNTYRHQHMPSVLGYKGFLVHHPEDEHPHLIVGQETATLQKVLLDTMPEGLLSDSLRQKISRAIDSGDVRANVEGGSLVTQRQDTSQIPSKKDQVGAIQHYAPQLNLRRWNDEYLIRANNNCYNYANDKITNSFAQPGTASGHPWKFPITDDEMVQCAKSDGLVKMNVAPSDPCPAAPPQPNCLVALVVADGYPSDNADFHWYRLDDNGLWSQKPGPTAATNLDGDGKLITDPRQAANSKHGPDYHFVSFMQIYTNIIDGPKGPH